MKNRKYVVCRDNIYVGEVIKTDNIERYNNDTDFFSTKPGKLTSFAYKRYRSMLFVPNENQLADDLLYQSNNYPILNITDDNICLNLKKNSIVIKDCCNLAPLLEYFGYNKELTIEDIIKIRKTFFTGKFAMDNCELFGYKEDQPEDRIYYKNGIEITDAKQLKKCIAMAKKVQQDGHRLFDSIPEHILPTEYFDVLDDLGDNTLRDILIGFDQKRNAFAPHREEGPVKKLKRF